MSQGNSMVGFVVIVVLYAVIGLMAAAGTILIARKFLAPKAEQIFYAMFLIMIAAFYLAFTGLLRSGAGRAAGNSCRGRVRRDKSAGRTPSFRTRSSVGLADVCLYRSRYCDQQLVASVNDP